MGTLEVRNTYWNKVGHAQGAHAAYFLFNLKERLEAHQSAFDNLVELIPAKYYFVVENDVDVNPRQRRKNKHPDHDEQVKAAKKRKLDPDSRKSALDVQRESLKNRTQEKVEKVNGHVNGTASVPTDPEPDESLVLKPTRAKTSEELKSLLVLKIEESRRARMKKEEANGSKGKSKWHLLEERQEKIKKREKDKQKRQQQNKRDKSLNGLESGNPGGESDSAPKPTKLPEIDDIKFGTVTFGDDHKKRGPSDVKTLLKKVEAKNEKLQNLRSADPEKAESIEEAERWRNMMKMAQGEKVKDQAKILKQTVKRIEKKKSKSATAWKERDSSVKKAQEDRQKKRNENIRTRQEKSKKGKRKAARPGFEGGLKGKEK
ncbi:surfeit locus protein 6-domain-containing protein [Cladochytrium replicatum]|nr:surfeit locus protein 6-domain-containing protein [Cladochytrium replicatum]